MQTKKIGNFLFQNWQILAIFLCCVMSLLNWWKNENSPWRKIPSHIKIHIESNVKIWESLDSDQKKNLLEYAHRFQQYPLETKEFLRLLNHNWQSLSLYERQRRKQAYKIFKNFSFEKRIKTRDSAIFMSCMALENIFFTSFNLLKDWNNFYSEISTLDPLELRNYIYFNFLLFHHLPFFPSHIRKKWEELLPDERLKIMKKMQKQLNQKISNNWLLLFNEVK